VYGAKHWVIYDEVVGLPYRDEEVGKDKPVDSSLLRNRREFFVQQGDLLYMPRGVVHEASAAEDQSSLHLTIALQSSDWDYASLLRDALSSILRQPEYRRSRDCCPLRFLLSREPVPVVDDDVTSTLSFLVEELARHKSVTADAARAQFCARMERMQQERRNQVNHQMVPMPLPIMLGSLIVWSCAVELEEVEDIHDDEIPTLRYLVRCSRVGSDKVVQRMSFACSAETFKCVGLLHQSHRVAPLAVADLPLFDDLARIAFAVMMTNNLCCSRIT
jgi:hypothetical protein